VKRRAARLAYRTPVRRHLRTKIKECPRSRHERNQRNREIARRSLPSHGLSPNSFRRCFGPEFIAATLHEWIAAVGSQTAYIEPESPRENGYCESFNSKLRMNFSIQPGRSPSADRGLAAPLQRRAPAQLAQLSTASAGNRAGNHCVRVGPHVPWASAPAVGGARSPDPSMASAGQMY
jgi:Integrase core domain